MTELRTLYPAIEPFDSGMLDVGDNLLIQVVKALLCTGLTMLMINLLKLSTLTHKKARNLWDPLDRLATSRFRRID